MFRRLTKLSTIMHTNAKMKNVKDCHLESLKTSQHLIRSIFTNPDVDAQFQEPEFMKWVLSGTSHQLSRALGEEQYLPPNFTNTILILTKIFFKEMTNPNAKFHPSKLEVRRNITSVALIIIIFFYV
jgi:hypothetical protein